MRQRRPKVTDPLTRDCTACGALAGKGCIATGNNGERLPLIPKAMRLVHAARLDDTERTST